MNTTTLDSRRLQAARARVQWLARLLDNAIGIPGTRIRLGWDALIGLIPGVGDALGVLLGGMILFEAARVKAPPALLARMGGNLALDAVLGVVPLLGDVLDVAFKANARNAQLLVAHLDRLELRKPRRAWLGYLLVAGVLAMTLLAFYGVWMLLVGLWG